MMDALQFTYWLNGFAELTGDEPPTANQWKSIKEHLGLVFTKVTPPIHTPLKTMFQPPIGWPVPPSAGDPLPQPSRATCQTGAANAAPSATKTLTIC